MLQGKELWNEVTKQSGGMEGEKELELPPYLAGEIREDFKWFLFSLSRYKFAAKMLEGKKDILEVGCSYGFKTRMLSQFIPHVTGVDFDKNAILYAQKHYEEIEKREYVYADILELEKMEHCFEGAVCLDVIEHIEKEKEGLFMHNILRNLKTHSVFILGTPNITAAKYQSEQSNIGHINLYSYERLKNMMSKYFHHVFMFSMNDEVVHTGFGDMAHYIFSIGVEKLETE